MKKYGYRLVISVLVYFFFRINSEQHWHDVFVWNLQSTVYLVYTIAVLFIIWEVVSRTVKYWEKRSSIKSNRGLYKISLKATLVVLPLVFLFSYIFTFYLKPTCDCQGIMLPIDPVSQLWMLSAQGFVIGLLVVAYEIIKVYIRSSVQDAREKELIKKELISAKFEGLKKQVNPHFLFNSFSVLSSLVEKEPKTAVLFIDKLSDMYRYILEHEEQDEVTLKEELNFLDDYLFLIKMRHRDGVSVALNFSVDEDKIKIPPMSIQMLVENAIKHNSFSEKEPLLISVNNEGDNFIVVENPKRKKEELITSTGIGLKNLSKRLNLSMKQGLEIVDSPGHFRVKLPLAQA